MQKLSSIAKEGQFKFPKEESERGRTDEQSEREEKVRKREQRRVEKRDPG